MFDSKGLFRCFLLLAPDRLPYGISSEELTIGSHNDYIRCNSINKNAPILETVSNCLMSTIHWRGNKPTIRQRGNRTRSSSIKPSDGYSCRRHSKWLSVWQNSQGDTRIPKAWRSHCSGSDVLLFVSLWLLAVIWSGSHYLSNICLACFTLFTGTFLSKSTLYICSAKNTLDALEPRLPQLIFFSWHSAHKVVEPKDTGAARRFVSVNLNRFLGDCFVLPNPCEMHTMGQCKSA